MYGRLNINAKFQNFLKKNDGRPNIEDLYKAEVKKLHADWDKTNALVRDTYPEVILPEEVMELGVVQFIEEVDLVYVDWHILKDTIGYLRTFDPLYGNMNSIIKDVLGSI